MIRPFIDAALLGAHGHSAAPVTRIRKGPRMSQDIRFALLPGLNTREQIKAFPDLNTLARHIQRERGDHGLDLNEVEDMEIADRPAATRGVEVWTMNDGNDRVRFIGYAYLDDQGLEALRAALRRNRLVIAPADHAEAA
jgi:hypothetical protein